MGAGINLFKQLFPENYYAYQTATLISSKPVSKKIYDSDNNVIAEYPLGGDELRGLLKVVDGKLIAYGDVKDSSGNIDVKFGIVDLSTIQSDISYNSGLGCWVVYQSVLAKYVGTNEIPNIIDSEGKTATYYYNPTKGDNKVSVNNNGYILIGNNSSVDKPTETIIYELATPKTASGTPFTNPMLCGSTEEFTDSRSLKMFCGHQSQYYTETEGDKLSALPEVTGEQGDFIINNADGKMTLKKRNVYSETEKVVGTWIDGKPIYEKTYVGTFSSDSTTLIIDTVYNSRAIISASGFLLSSNNNYSILINGCADSSSSDYVAFNGVTYDDIVIKRAYTDTCGSTPTAYVTVRYIKR